MTKPKLCIDCRHYSKQGFVQDPHRCNNPRIAIDVVTGNSQNVSASLTRAAGGQCGPDGKLWEGKVLSYPPHNLPPAS